LGPERSATVGDFQPSGVRADDRSAWNAPLPETVPRPTYWPLFLAAGIVLAAYGLIFSLWFIALGVVVFAVALAGWIGELRHEHGPDGGPE